jgi:hypothetical protein
VLDRRLRGSEPGVKASAWPPRHCSGGSCTDTNSSKIHTKYQIHISLLRTYRNRLCTLGLLCTAHHCSGGPATLIRLSPGFGAPREAAHRQLPRSARSASSGQSCFYPSLHHSAAAPNLPQQPLQAGTTLSTHVSCKSFAPTAQPHQCHLWCWRTMSRWEKAFLRQRSTCVNVEIYSTSVN